MTSNRLRILAGATLLLAAALGVGWWLSWKSENAGPPPLMTAEAARALANTRSQTVPLAAPSLADRWWPGFSYAAFEAEFPPNQDISPFFLAFHDRGVKTIVLSATVTLGRGPALPSLPLMVLRAEGRGFRPGFAAEGRFTPYLPMDEMGRANIVLDVSYRSDDSDDVIEAAKAAWTAARDLRLAPLAEASSRYGALLASDEGPRFASLLSPVLTVEAPAIRLALQGAGNLAAGGIVLRMTTRKPVLVDPVVSGLPAVFDVLAPLGLGAEAIETLAGVPAERWAEACQDYRRRLTEDFGFGPVDRAIALWALAGRAALFAAPGSAETCFDEATRATLKGLALAESGPPGTAIAEARLRAWLDAAAQVMTPALAEKGRTRLGKLMSSLVLVQGIAAVPATFNGDRVAPTLTAAEAMDFLAGLPVGRMSCARRDPGAARTGLLLTLENDSALYRLDAVFDEEGLAQGLRLGEASQDDLCRAAQRRPADGPCLFAAGRAKFRNVDPARCPK